MPKLIHTPEWQALLEHYESMRKINLIDLFDRNENRFANFSIEHESILLDYSKNFLTEGTVSLLRNLAVKSDLSEWIEKMFTGEKINFTEKRAVLHTALRNRSDRPVVLDGEDVMPKIRAVLDKMKSFADGFHTGKITGASGKRFTDIVNIGIGGSDLGPAMCADALKPFAKKNLNIHFVSNVDGTHIAETLKKVKPKTTLFLISSKTFTTQETMTNARTARDWFLSNGMKPEDVARHFVAISTNEKAVTEFGIARENMFEFWDFVGGRYSVWSAIGLSLALYIGMDGFIEFLEGAHSMDEHFRSAPLERNIPVMLGLIGVWYANFFGAKNYAVIPYDQYLDKLPDYLQQLDMESNGKYIDREGRPVNYTTGAVLFGRAGTNSQHSFFQLIHQGTQVIPIDFIGSVKTHNPVGNHHDILMSNLFAQSEALMRGKSSDEVCSEMRKAGVSEIDIQNILPYKVFEGNRPSNTILLKSVTPRSLGSLLAMYELKVFVQGIIWRINSFDQWGVELGKQLAGKILPELGDSAEIGQHDSSTRGLIEYYRKEK
jgi:glucose-6-phosphate isomerase